MLVGEAGPGKTTLVQATIQGFERQGAKIAYLNNPTLTRGEFYEFLAAAFELDPATAHSKCGSFVSWNVSSESAVPRGYSAG